MKAILEFDLPEDREEYSIYSKGPAFMAVLSCLAQELRIIRKHEGERSADYLLAVERIWNKLWDLAAYRGVTEEL